ncbi:MAG: adenylosuccinate lyase, partial [Bdellovibrionales bacterium]|nr:adenylosuccinate lyase [Bdellovibrionales bacterium]NQZ19719.1 adenylosuccinate lyase [Bdellovibrionales bacterium]
DISQGQLFSSHLLLHMVDQGLSREEAYKKVQAVSHGLQEGDHLQTSLLKSEETKKYFDENVLEEIFSGKRHLDKVGEVIQKTLEL